MLTTAWNVKRDADGRFSCPAPECTYVTSRADLSVAHLKDCKHFRSGLREAWLSTDRWSPDSPPPARVLRRPENRPDSNVASSSAGQVDAPSRARPLIARDDAANEYGLPPAASRRSSGRYGPKEDLDSYAPPRPQKRLKLWVADGDGAQASGSRSKADDIILDDSDDDQTADMTSESASEAVQAWRDEMSWEDANSPESGERLTSMDVVPELKPHVVSPRCKGDALSSGPEHDTHRPDAPSPFRPPPPFSPSPLRLTLQSVPPAATPPIPPLPPSAPPILSAPTSAMPVVQRAQSPAIDTPDVRSTTQPILTSVHSASPSRPIQMLPLTSGRNSGSPNNAARTPDDAAHASRTVSSGPADP